jgi:mono/diheme cytochrome c family protein
MRSACAFALACALFAACGGGLSEALQARATTIEGLTGDATKGQMLFTTNCARCHGADGKGGDPGPNLTGSTKTEVVENMFTGPGEMPTFEALSDQDLADIAAWVTAIP